MDSTKDIPKNAMSTEKLEQHIKNKIAVEAFELFKFGVESGLGLQRTMQLLYDGFSDFSKETRGAVEKLLNEYEKRKGG